MSERPVDRRQALRVILAAPLVFAACGGESSSPPRGEGAALLARARALQRERDLPVLLLAIPDEAEAPRRLGEALHRLEVGVPAEPGLSLTHHGDPALDWNRERRAGTILLASCVLVALERDEVRKALGREDDAFALDGTEVRRADASPLADGRIELFATRCLELVHGESARDLADRVAKRSRGRHGDEAEALLAALRARPLILDPAEGETPELGPEAERLAVLLDADAGLESEAALALHRDPRESDDWARTTELEALLRRRHVRSGLLPLGTYRPEFTAAACGGALELDPDATHGRFALEVACGLPRRSSTGGRFLRFVGDAPRTG
ncbi:MAG: hypothetical protein R3F20_06305 [Planctomycetota bacterium]